MIQRKEENDRRNYFIINLLESMGPGRDRTRDPWICSQTRIAWEVNYYIKTGVVSPVCNYLRPSNNSRQLIFNINAVVLIVIIC